MKTHSQFDWQGHRGCRGLMPENTVPAFLEALRYPVTTLEMDVVMSADSVLIVSHDPWMDPAICTGPGGQELGTSVSALKNIFGMSLEEIRQYDCGSKGNPKFERQQKIAASKPTLAEVVEAVRAYCKREHRKLPEYNIEIKSRPDWYDIYTPRPDIFTTHVLNELKRLDIDHRTTLQSFDVNVLRLLREKDKSIPVSYLVENAANIDSAIDILGFVPEIFSPGYWLVSVKTVDYARSHGMKLIPWTVNTVEDMKRLKNLGVDGIITDYPDLIGQVQ